MELVILVSFLPLLLDLLLKSGTSSQQVFLTETFLKLILEFYGLHHRHEFFLLFHLVLSLGVQISLYTFVSVFDSFLLLIVFQESMRILRDLQVMLHRQLLVVIRLQLLRQLLIVGDFAWADKEAGSLFSLLKGEHKVENGFIRSFFLLSILFEVLLLDQRVTEGLRHLDLTLSSIILVVLSPLLIDPDDLLLDIKVSLLITLPPPLSFLYLPLLLLLHDYLLDPQLLDGGVLLLLLVIAALRDRGS